MWSEKFVYLFSNTSHNFLEVERFRLTLLESNLRRDFTSENLSDEGQDVLTTVGFSMAAIVVGV